MEAIFDHSAILYDEDFTYTRTGRMQRERVWKYLEQMLPSDRSLNILEVNCGTGEDAMFLAARGHHITATDLSSEMIRVAQQKYERRPVGSIRFQTMAMEDMNKEFAHQKFDLILSDFGGLNCLPPAAIKKLLEDLNGMLAPNGRFIGVIMPRFCLVETCYFLLKGKWKKAFRRRSKQAVPANVKGQTQLTWYYGPSFIRQSLPAGLTVKTNLPVGFLLPPSYLEPFVWPKKVLLSMLSKLENLIGNCSFLSGCSDHFLMDIRKL